MGEFFKGRRRKAGLVMLAMACVLMVGWVRSLFDADQLSIPSKEARYFVESSMGELRVYRFPAVFAYNPTHSNSDMHSTWSLPGIEAWTGTVYSLTDPVDKPWIPFDLIVFRYWVLTWPLTLLSAWLILVKPRAKKESPEIQNATRTIPHD